MTTSRSKARNESKEASEWQAAGFRRILGGIFLGLTYGILLSAGALLCAGPGDGTYVPYVWSCAPLTLFRVTVALWLSPLYWATCGLLSVMRPRSGSRLPLLAFLLVHYIVALLLTMTTDLYDPPKLREGIVLFVPWVAVYLGGQTVLWIVLVRKRCPRLSGYATQDTPA